MAEKQEPRRTELAVVPKTSKAIVMQAQLAEMSEMRALLRQFVDDNLTVGVDYGVIPGTQKPTLFKPGADKVAELYRCDTDEPVLDREVEDWDAPFFHYRFKVVLRYDGRAKYGVGSCNSHETKYRYRDAKLKCPTCEAEAIRRSKDGRGWYCWTKLGGCGAVFPRADEPGIVNQPRGKVENTDAADLTNTVLKMAMKRAQVAAALQLPGVSDMFTQDVEDLPEDMRERVLQPQDQESPFQAQAAKKPGNGNGKPGAEAAQSPGLLKRRAWAVWETMKAGGASPADFKAWAAKQIGHQRPQPEWTEEDVAKLERASKGQSSAPPVPSHDPVTGVVDEPVVETTEVELSEDEKAIRAEAAELTSAVAQATAATIRGQLANELKAVLDAIAQAGSKADVRELVARVKALPMPERATASAAYEARIKELIGGES